ncbi:hypothetical protein SAMN05444722_1210 [Rhodovulum sp. ES.010]|uniref:hypothetical protein n=1 Tax=Rhodovulum sp. ES.010 TaxID=1882821 RepID=UPI00092AF69D|nr:hypothetical protein [Rhodovulum sp. ES.010]SIO28512.1 hypothetical protein SAMN05444722_1210 [Rhodovulum sp. ES.010]
MTATGLSPQADLAKGFDAPGQDVAVAFLATLLMGPFGMAYSTRIGAIVMVAATLLVALPTLGLGVVLTLPICMLWAVLAAVANRRRA